MVISDQVVLTFSPRRSRASWMSSPICSGVLSSMSGMVTRWKVWACTAGSTSARVGPTREDMVSRTRSRSGPFNRNRNSKTPERSVIPTPLHGPHARCSEA
ncbi:hypothetical protein SAMN05421811_113195 [Nonomuraea wenchangensis]|uniref:Uncharacterized protein n=1 Tax=Nonomuraea wenchangensis TaxID=568860 RepID=A0A1I0L9J6_9ACTN|nr:hypothetical protein SAMN05421811_113195 [Nonomuraea wenchangensis]